MKKTPALCLLLLAIAAPNSPRAQRGDKANEAQPDTTKGLDIPDAPVLSPKQALAAFRIQRGFVIELAAAEPLVEDPVVIAFDARARMWVAEMTGFMPNIDAKGEEAPIGRVAVLNDTDGDGVYDARKVFLDKLVLPRAILPYQDGLLLIEPPKLYFCRDKNGDDVCDAREVVLDKGFEAGIANPEHAGNGFIVGHDGWIYLANFGKRLRRVAGKWIVERSQKLGQWGLCQDDWGRQYFNYNSTYLYSAIYSPHYGGRNPAHGVALGTNLRLDGDQKTWPIRINPGINRGYQKQMLRDGYLARFTAACGPGVARGHLMPDCLGDVFVPEPAGNFVRRAVIKEQPDGRPKAKNAYQKAEFLASTDERFRPVNCLTGPDGALYIVDFYRGVIQHRNFVTSFLRKQVVERKLETPLGLGRIWRIRQTDKAGKAEPVAALDTAQLVASLGHPNGWVRDQAQRQLVDRAAKTAAPGLRKLFAESQDARVRRHTLWTLHGLAELQRADLDRALADPHPRVRSLGVRLSEHFADVDLSKFFRDPAAVVRIQVGLSLGERKATERLALLAEYLLANAGDNVCRNVAMSSLRNLELPLLRRLLAAKEWRKNAAGRGTVLRLLAKLVVRRKKADEILAMFAGAAEAAPFQQSAVLRGASEGLPRGKARKGSISLPSKPVAWDRLRKTPKAGAWVKALESALSFPGSAVVAKKARPLTKREQLLFKLGKHYYANTCTQCHQAHGRGQAGLAPTLHGSDIVLGPPGRQIRVVLHGLTGPVEIDGQKQVLTMEPLAEKLNDRQIAAVITFTRRMWGHTAEPATVEEVKRIRAETKDRKKPWTRAELEKIR